MFCKNCGNQISDEARFCKFCGATIEHTPIVPLQPTVNTAEAPQPEAASATPASKKFNKKWLASIIAAVLVIVIVIISVVTKSPEDSTPTDNDYNNPSFDFNQPSSPSYDYSQPDTPSADNNNPPSTLPIDGKRTIMIYIVGSDLESKYGAATLDIQEMIDAQFDVSKTQVLLCAGGATSWQNNVVSSSETSYYQVTDDAIVKVQTLGKKNMGSSSTLSSFLDWGASAYPADSYGLILWNHGGGPIYGYGMDQISGDSLSMKEMVSALSASPFGSSNKLEFLGFDACIMGSVETAWLFKDYAEYYIGSQEVEPGYGWDYEFLSDIPYCRNGAEVGKEIVDSYFEFYDDLFRKYPREETEITLSCIDLSKIGAVETAVNNLFSSVNRDVLDGRIAVASRCRSSSKAFGKIGTTSMYDLVDLKHIASLLSSSYSEASSLERAVDSAVYYSRANIKNANGLSIYHPYDNKQDFPAIKNIYNSFNFANKYSSYIVNFMSCLQSGTNNQSSYRGFSKTTGKATANGQKSELEIQLTSEQMKTFSSAKYYVFWEMPASETFSKKTEYLQVFSGQDVNVTDSGKLTATYSGKAVFGKNKATGKYSDCPLSMNQIYDGSLDEKYYFPCMFWYFGDNLDMEVENVNWLMRIKNGTPSLLNAYYMENNTDNQFPDKQLINPDNYTVYSFVNNSYFVSKDKNQNTVFELSGSIYGFEYTKEEGFDIELRPVQNKSQYRAVFLIEDIYGNTYFSDFIPLK